VTPQTHRDDQSARNRIRESLAESLIVEASAGTGKTSELVRRIVRVLATGLTTIDKIVAVTFTNKAAGELKLRLRKELDDARAHAPDPAEARCIEAALEHLEEAAIGTIHAFCAQILHERPVEAVVDPAFQELSQPEAERLYQRAFRGWIQQKLSESAPGLRRAFARMAWQETAIGEYSPMEQLQETGRKLVEWRDFPAAWRTARFDRSGEIDALVRRVEELAGMCRQCKRWKDNLVRALQPLTELAVWIERAELNRSRDYDTLESRLLRLMRDLRRENKKGSGLFAEGVPRADVLARRDELLLALEAFRRRADAGLAATLRAEMWGVVDCYQELKRRSGKLDFVDLLILVRNLVVEKPEVRRYLQERFSHIFVDEFQDTDPLQAEILLLLAAADPDETHWQAATPKTGKLFVVGDPKQSIYKFRRADVLLYQQVREALCERGVGLVRLTQSFRAVRPIQECVNAAFAPEMSGDATAAQTEYVPLDPYHETLTGQPSIVALPAPRPYATRKVAKTAINACLPDTIVAFVDWLVHESGWKVRDAEDSEKLVPLAPRHVCLLFRRFVNWGQDLTRDYVRSFEARNVPHLLVGSKSFHKREEVETLRAALSAIEWPDDELALFAALKGSLFAIPDSTLLRFRHEIGKLHPFTELPEPLADDFKPVAEALRLMADLHRGRNRRPIAGSINQLLEAARAHAGFALRPAGHQVLANVYRVCDLARSFETGGGISFRGFVEELAAQAERQESAEAPVLEEGSEGVRLMTVHTAKGLEFPVVILADMTANLAAAEPDKHVDASTGLCAMRLLRCAPAELLEKEAEEKARELAEGVRVAYVAATRARDLLVVPVCGDEERDGWISPLNKAVYPPRDRYRQAQRAPDCCPPFGDASVLARPDDYIGHAEFSVKPGLHRAQAGGHDVVWWDPGALKLSAGGSFGLRQEEILAEGGPDDGLARYREWCRAREQTIAAGERMEFHLLTPSDAGGTPAGFDGPVEIDESLSRPGRPAGARFGTLLHLVLRDIELAGAGADAEALARMHGRLLGAEPEETEAAAQAARAALAHPLMERARKAERCHRELPVMLRLEENRMLEGVIDLAFLEQGAWTVVDFKSDADLKARRADYRRQLQWYGAALARITGQPVRGWILGV
jgi:ATP-dependent exoDNAse (exonuclease V) beta subunit